MQNSFYSESKENLKRKNLIEFFFKLLQVVFSFMDKELGAYL